MASKASATSSPGQALPRHRRIRQRADFEQAFGANRWANKWFTLYARKNETGCARLGLVVSKRIMPRSVDRNFTKRIIRETFRSNFLVTRPVDVVVRARQRLNAETSVSGRQALVQLLLTVTL